MRSGLFPNHKRSLHRPVITLLGLILLWTLSPASKTPKKNDRKESEIIAVLDFDASKDTQDWSIGLSDLLFMELQSRGLPMAEREEIRLILSERKLHRSGLIDSETVIREKLPWVRYLLRGLITKRPASRFILTVSLLDAFNGKVLFESRQEGAYPSEIAAGITAAAEEISSHIRRINILSQHVEPGKTMPGMTKIPEVALIFFRGVHHFIQGRPERAIGCFISSFDLDRTFLAAKLWEAKSYESLGLKEHARYAYDEAAFDFPDSNIEKTLAAKKTNLGKRVIALLTSPELDRAFPDMEHRLKNILAGDTDVGLLDPAWIPAIAGEMDLELSGEFAFPSTLKNRSWLLADLFLHAGIAENGNMEENTPRIVIKGIEAASGTVVFELRFPATRIISEPDRISEILSREIHKKSGTGITISETTPVSQKTIYEENQREVESPQERYGKLLEEGSEALAPLFLRYAKEPSNKTAIMEMLDTYHRIESNYASERSQLPHQMLLMRKLQSLIQQDEPEAAEWLSTALWGQHLIKEWCVDQFHPRTANPPEMQTVARKIFRLILHRDETVPHKDLISRELLPIQREFTPLLEKFPGSFAALLVRYSIAIEMMNKNAHFRAYAILKQLSREIPARDKYGMSPEFFANLHFFTAWEAYRVNRREDAVLFLGKAFESAGKEGTGSELSTNDAVGITFNMSSDRDKKKWFAGDLQHQPPLRINAYYNSPRKSANMIWNTLNEDMGWLYQELGEKGPLPFPDSLSEKKDSATLSQEKTVREIWLDRFRATVRKRENIAFQHEIMDMLRQAEVLKELGGEAEIKEIRSLFQSRLEAFIAETPDDDFSQVIRMLALLDDYNALNSFGEIWIAAENPMTQGYGVIAKGTAIRIKRGREAQAAFLQKELERRAGRTKGLNGGYSSYEENHVLTDLTFRTACAWKRLGEYSRAMQAYTAGIKSLESHYSGRNSTPIPSFRYYLAETREVLGDRLEAADILKRIVEAHPKGKIPLQFESLDMPSFHMNTWKVTDSNPCIHEAALQQLEFIRMTGESDLESPESKNILQKEFDRALNIGDVSRIRRLISLGADIDAVDENGRTPLHWVATENRRRSHSEEFLEIGRLLLEKGAQKEKRDIDGRTPLLVAIRSGNTEFVKLLLEFKASMNIIDKEGLPPLHIASRGEKIDIVQVLLKKGIDIDSRSRKLGETALHWMTQDGDQEMVKFLLEKGADIDVRDTQIGSTPLMWAAAT